MSDKELVIDALRRLPEDVTLDKISEEISILVAIHRGESAAAAGRFVPHSEVKQRSQGWTSK